MNPISSLFKSRKFLLLLLDTLISTILYISSAFFPDYVEMVKQFVIILQPVFVAVIIGIAFEDGAKRLGGNGE